MKKMDRIDKLCVKILASTFLIGIFLILFFVPRSVLNTSNNNSIRITTGNYLDYMVINTVDGNDWLLDDGEPKNNPYMTYDSEYQEYVSLFENEELVQVVFDTKGTEDIKDDTILYVSKIN